MSVPRFKNTKQAKFPLFIIPSMTKAGSLAFVTRNIVSTIRRRIWNLILRSVVGPIRYNGGMQK